MKEGKKEWTKERLVYWRTDG